MPERDGQPHRPAEELRALGNTKHLLLGHTNISLTFVVLWVVYLLTCVHECMSAWVCMTTSSDGHFLYLPIKWWRDGNIVDEKQGEGEKEIKTQTSPWSRCCCWLAKHPITNQVSQSEPAMHPRTREVTTTTRASLERGHDTESWSHGNGSEEHRPLGMTPWSQPPMLLNINLPC